MDVPIQCGPLGISSETAIGTGIAKAKVGSLVLSSIDPGERRNVEASYYSGR